MPVQMLLATDGLCFSFVKIIKTRIPFESKFYYCELSC